MSPQIALHSAQGWHAVIDIKEPTCVVSRCYFAYILPDSFGLLACWPIIKIPTPAKGCDICVGHGDSLMAACESPEQEIMERAAHAPSPCFWPQVKSLKFHMPPSFGALSNNRMANAHNPPRTVQGNECFLVQNAIRQLTSHHFLPVGYFPCSKFAPTGEMTRYFKTYTLLWAGIPKNKRFFLSIGYGLLVARAGRSKRNVVPKCFLRRRRVNVSHSA